MRKPAQRRKKAAAIATTLVTFSLGMMLSVVVAGSASAAPPTTTATTTTPASQSLTDPTAAPQGPADQFFVINGTVNASSDHEIVGSSAFPNFTTGAVDNYYSMSHSHVDNAPFAEGTASPLDTGPVGQTAAAGNFQQPQYADSRWPGDAKKATYGNQGGPYAEADAGDYAATAQATLAKNALSGPPGTPSGLAVPKLFDTKLRLALANWRSTWAPRLNPGAPAPSVTIPKAPVTRPKPPARPSLPQTPGVTTPLGTVTTPTPHAVVGGSSGSSQQPPAANVPPVTIPTLGAAPASRSMASYSADTPTDGESLLESSTSVGLVATGDAPAKTTTAATTTTTKSSTSKTSTTPAAPTKTYALVTSGESRLGRVVLGGGQIVIDGIHVTASITNDGTTPSYKAAVSIASATIGGIPVTIDQDGVHIAGQGGAIPYQQASDALNGALKQAGIQLFLVQPEVKTFTSGSCDSSSGDGGGSSNGTTTTSTTSSTTTTSSGDQSNSPPPGCDQSGMGTSCDQSSSGSSSGSGGSTPPGLPGQSTTTTSKTTTTRTTTTSTDQTSTTPSSSCDTSSSYSGSSGGTACTAGGTLGGTGTTGANSQTTTSTTDTTTTSTTPEDGSSMDSMSSGNSGEETVRATGLHVVFTQPVSQSGVPDQFVEHIFGEVFVDSLAVPATPFPSFDFSASSSFGSGSGFGSGPGCLNGGRSHSGSSAGGIGSSGGVAGASAGGSLASGSMGSGASGFGTSQSGSGSPIASLPAAFAAALKKPLWLLVTYLLWQALVIGTGASLWHWRRGDAS